MSEQTMQAFARACAEQNSVAEILDGLEMEAEGQFFFNTNEASLADCIDWDLTPLEWVGGLILGLLFKLAEPVPNWEQAEATARALKEWGVGVESREDKNGDFHFSLQRGRQTLRQIADAVPRIRHPEEMDR
ncbi:MAG: hypothetical protein GXY82_02355 [Methanospirillum sp.]|nr:hypothetical protein [Methanospirillum sp.]